jgi:hypothetical protein
MKINQKYVIMLLLIVTVIIGVAAIVPPAPVHPKQFVNLKVLPKNISDSLLYEIMKKDFNRGLGVKCGFCHAPNKDSSGLDFASDAKSEKNIAREMMRMAIGINSQYFKIEHPMIGDQALAVTCVTCHNGKAFPDNDSIMQQKK